ncbi:MAG: hypothetical protein ABFE01_20465 [Phycisphaerales bacterium]
MMSGSLALQRTVAGLAGAYLSARGLVSAIKSVTAAGIEAESADRGMIAALRIRGQYSEQNVEMLRRQADGMEDLTVYSRNAIKQQQALALTMGASVPEIGAMTEAAVGLASAYKKDLSQTMRTVALARQGETGQLKEMGIVVDRTKSKQQQFLQVMAAGRANFDKARADTETLGGAIAQLRNEWEQTKESMAKPLTPALKRAMRFIRQELEGGQGGQTTWYKTQSLSEQQQASLFQAYEQRLQEQAQARMPNGYTATRNDWREDPAYLAKLTAAYERSGQVQAKIKGGDGASAAAGATAAQREQIVRLNEQIKEQIAIQREANAGNLQAAETVKYLATVEETYGKGTKEAQGAMVKYNSAMEMLNELRSRAAASEYLQQLKEEGDILELQRAGLKDQARLQEIVNETKRQGLKLTPEEKDAIGEQIKRVRQLQEHYQSLGDGIKGAFAEIKDQMQTVGDLASDVVKKGFDGVAESIADAAVYGEDLKESLKQVAQEIAHMVVKWAVMQAMSAMLPNFGEANVGHSGGVIGQTAFASRRDSPANWIGAPRLHDGLRPDEFRFIGQRGERITSRSGVATEGRLMGRMVTLLERIATRRQTTAVTILDKRQSPQEWFQSRSGEQAWQYHASRNQ